MNSFATLYDYLIQKNGATETFPFGEDVLVMKVMGKIFALLPLDETPTRISLKCDPARALELRAQYDAIAPGYHMSKQHWNTLTVDGRLPVSLVLEPKITSGGLCHSIQRHNRSQSPGIGYV